MDGLRLDFGLLLKPLGFIKVLKWIFSIFAFATCGGFQGETTLLVSCKDVVNKTVTAAFAYPSVLVFLYCIAALVVYIGYKHVYQQNNKFPLTDFTITVITVFLWLFSTFAWTKAIADIKMSTGASIIPGIESCKAPGTTCHFASVTSMGTLNVSVVFGLLNTVLRIINIWFMYEDSNLHHLSNRISQSQGIYPPQTEV